MKKTLYILIILFLGSFNQAIGQYFSATIDAVDNELTISIKPVGGDITTGFSGMEFFIRTVTATPAFTFGDPIENITNFPDVTQMDYNGENQQGNDAGYRNYWFSWSLGTSTATSQTYLQGQVYEVFKVELSNGSGSAPFQIAANDWYSPTYLVVNSPTGDLTNLSDLVFGSNTGNHPGSNGGTTYYNQVENVTLPISLLDFAAWKQGQTSARIEWKVREDEKLDVFEIERSEDGFNWEYIQAVLPTEKNNDIGSYAFIDKDVYNGKGKETYYYRLKIVDLDNRFVYSPFDLVHFGSDLASHQKLLVFPNPSKSNINLDFDLSIKDKWMNITVFDIFGKQVYSKKEYIDELPFNLKGIESKNLENGIYHIWVSDDQAKVYKSKFLIQR